jgi:hypothetical protein
MGGLKDVFSNCFRGANVAIWSNIGGNGDGFWQQRKCFTGSNYRLGYDIIGDGSAEKCSESAQFKKVTA